MNPGTSVGSGYEFTTAENGIISKLAKRLRIAGILQAVVGVLMLLGFASRTVALRAASPVLTFGVDLPIAAATIAAGVMMALAAPPFVSVVQTQGQDVEHVMSACGKLSTLMTLLLVAFGVAMVVWLGVFVWLMATGTPLVHTEPPG